jgi:hypothetical protein
VRTAAADTVSVIHLHFGYILYGIIACSLEMFKHYVKEELDIYFASNNWVVVNNEF